jgi:drug/metabolite transporter (DMT)-like permease
MKKETRNAYIALGLVSFFWGTTYVVSRVGAQEMPGLYMAGLRQFISGLLLVGFFLLKGYKLPEWKVIKQISIQGIFLLCIANGLLTWALEYISGGLAAIIVALVPLFIALFSMWLSKCAKITRWMIVGLVVGFAGVLLIFSDYMGEMKNGSFVFGVVLSLISVLSWSFGTVYTSRQKPVIDIMFGVGLQMLIAGIIMLIVCGLTGKYINIANAGQDALLSLVYLIVFGSLVAYSAYVFALSKLPATQVSVYAYINPVVAVGLGWLLLAEKMNAVMLIGMLITLGGVYIVNHESKKLKHE